MPYIYKQQLKSPIDFSSPRFALVGEDWLPSTAEITNYVPSRADRYAFPFPCNFLNWESNSFNN